MKDFALAQFTSSGTAADVSVSLGFTPAIVIAVMNAAGTNPDIRIWPNKDVVSQHAGADDTFLITGATGIITNDTASLAKYAGGDDVTATDVTNRRYAKRDGSLFAAGDKTTPGFFVPAGDQTNSGVNLFFCFRGDRL